MDNLKSWLVPLLSEKGCRLYGIEWDRSMKPPVLRIAIEKNDGTIDLDTCALCSDAISARLDENDPFDGEYMLEVCSPGAERDLKDDQDLQNAVGKYVYIKLKNAQDGIKEVRGDLTNVSDDAIDVSYFVKGRPKKIQIAKDNIAKAMTAVKV